MTAVKWITGLFLLLVLAAGGCVALDDVASRADAPDVDWPTVTPAEMKALIESGEVDPNAVYTGSEGEKFSPLMKVVGDYSDLEVLDVLVQHGADIDWSYETEIFNMTPLGLAVHNGDIERARRLLELGADPARADSITPPIFYALSNPDQYRPDLVKSMMDLLLSYGADINGLDRASSRSFYTPLIIVVLHLMVEERKDSYAGLLSYMVSRGAEIDILASENAYGSAMSYAVWNKDADVIKELIALGGDVNFVNGYGCYTPLLHFIQAGQNMETFDALIAAGADLDHVCPDGRDVMSVIEERKKGDREEILYFYTQFSEIIDSEKFLTEQSWLDFADEITARIEDLCEETTYNVCNEMEKI